MWKRLPTSPAPLNVNVGNRAARVKPDGGRFERRKFRKPVSSGPPNIELGGGGRSRSMWATGHGRLASQFAVAVALCQLGLATFLPSTVSSGVHNSVSQLS